MQLFLSAFRDTVEFANPEYLMAIPIAFLLSVFGVLIFILRVFLRPAKTHGSLYPLVGQIKFWFFAVVVLVAVAAAAARPYWVYGGRTFKRGDVDVAIVVDGSASMWVKDLGPSRLDLAVREALNLYTEEILTPGDRTALFVFGTTAVRKAHLSSDSDRFVEQVGRVEPPVSLSGDAFPWDSDIASAFEHVYQSIDNQDKFESQSDDWTPERRSDRLVLLFTDGDFIGSRDQMARLDTALSEFQRRGLTVYPIGIGSRTGTNLDIVLQDYIRGIDYDESLEADLKGLRTQLSADGLDMLQQRTGGRAFVLESPGVSSAPFVRNAVNSHRSISFQLVPAEDKQEMWQWVLAFAVVIFVVAVLFY
jgi:hypothetical protein